MSERLSQAITGLLIAAVFVCALLVVFSKHRQRLLFAEYQQLQIRTDRAEVEWGQLLLEEATLGNMNRVEQIAADQLDMRVPEPDQVVLVVK